MENMENMRKRSKELIYYSLNKPGHYDNYEKVFVKLFNCDIERTIFFQCFKIFSYKRIIFIDGDKFHLLFAPLMILRSFINRKNFIISIRIEFLLKNGYKMWLKKLLFLTLKRLPNISIISIHRADKTNNLKSYANHFIYDLQYWDLPYLKIAHRPVEEVNRTFETPTILVFGKLNRKRVAEKLIELMSKKSKRGYHFIISGKNNFAKNTRNKLNECTIIDRYVTDDEMIYLFSFSDFIYCYYSPDVNRPSGIFGRAMQLEKKIIVRRNGYLHRNHKDYPGLIPIVSLDDISDIIPRFANFEFKHFQKYDDSTFLRKIILG